MISSNLAREGHASRILIRQDSVLGQQAGLLMDFVVMTDNLATIYLAGIHRVIGSLPMDQIDAALRHTLGL